MPATLAQVTIPAASGLADDAIVNTFAIGHVAAAGLEPGEITIPIAGFYTTAAPGATASVGSYISGKQSRAAGMCSIKLYDISADLSGSPHGSPYFEDSFTLPAAADATSLPTEVALVLTLHGAGREEALVETADDGDPDSNDADSLVDRPKQRRTGRIFVGPFNLAAHSQGRPSTAVQEDLLDAAQELKTELEVAGTGGPYLWGVWSRKNASIYELEAVSVDNAFDTQRRRGNAPTARLLRQFV